MIRDPYFKNLSEYVYRDCHIRMSVKAMSNLLYAVIITHAGIPLTWTLGAYEYTRQQNAYNGVDVKVHIHPDNIEAFEKLSGAKLEKPQSVTVNS